jgi:hypothetical protein
MSFTKLWVSASVITLAVLWSFEIKYEIYAKQWESCLTTRRPSALETPGFIVNKCAMWFYHRVLKIDVYSIWQYRVRALVVLIYVLSSAILGFIVSWLVSFGSRRMKKGSWPTRQ